MLWYVRVQYEPLFNADPRIGVCVHTWSKTKLTIGPIVTQLNIINGVIVEYPLQFRASFKALCAKLDWLLSFQKGPVTCCPEPGVQSLVGIIACLCEPCEPEIWNMTSIASVISSTLIFPGKYSHYYIFMKEML